MNVLETGAIVARIIAGDNRRGGEDVIEYWHELIGELDYADCVEAVKRHRKTSTEWLQPAHIHGWVKEIRRERYEKAGGEGAAIKILSYMDFDTDSEYRTALRNLKMDMLAGKPLPTVKELGW